METSFSMAYKVFMADSSSSAIKTVQMAFQDTGVDLYTAEDGSEVIDIIQKVHPDAIILALSLPNKDGYEIAFDLTREDQFKETPLLVLQGVFEDLDEDRIKDFEHAEVIRKPFDSEELVSKVQSLMGQALNPDTLPEEPEVVHSGEEKLKKEIPATPNLTDLEERLRQQIKHEVLGLERELEKRIVSRVKAELSGSRPDNSQDDEGEKNHTEVW